MTEVELVTTDLYDALIRLQYPGIAQVPFKDFESVILTGPNRISLLSWLLTRSSQSLSTTLEELKDDALKAELVKCYSQMGICNNRNTLLDSCAINDQLGLLKLLLLFIKNVHLTDSKTLNSVEESAALKILEKQSIGTMDIIPPLCSVSSKLNYSEANKYLEEIRKSLREDDYVSTVQHNSSAVESLPISMVLFEKEETSPNRDSTNSADKELSIVASAEKFVETFDSVATWSKSKSTNFTTNHSNSLDENIQSIYYDFSTVNQVLGSKEALSNLIIPTKLDKIDTPLSQIIEETVIGIEKISSLYYDDRDM